MMQVLEEAGFEGGVLQAVRVEDRSGIPRFYLVRNEGAECDEARLHGQVGYESEAALRIGFLGATRANRTWHAPSCTGWCGLAVVALAEQVQEAFAQRAGEYVLAELAVRAWRVSSPDTAGRRAQNPSRGTSPAR